MNGASVSRPAAAPRPDRRIEVVPDEDRFRALGPLWDGVVEAAAIGHPFLGHAWARVWWECFGAGRRLRVLLVREGTEVTALAPLLIEETRMCGLPVRRIGLLHNDHTPLCDVVLARRPAESCAAIWDHLAARRDEWDVLELRQLPAASPALAEFRRLAARDRFLTGVWRPADSLSVPLDGGWDRYLMSLSHNHRAKMRKGLRRLERIGDVVLETIDSEADLDGALEDGFRLEAAGWKGRRGTAILCSPILRRFYDRLARASAATGGLSLFFLTVGGRRVAFAYALRHQRRLFVLKAGFDPDWGAYSPYNVLTFLILRDACRRGLAGYEFLGADEEWKRHWAPERRAHLWFYVLPRSPRGRLIHDTKFRMAPALARIRPYRILRDAVLGGRGR